jgi:hypothetical protein
VTTERVFLTKNDGQSNGVKRFQSFDEPLGLFDKLMTRNVSRQVLVDKNK